MVMKRSMVAFLIQLLFAFRSPLTRRARLEAENLLLRQQLIVLRRKSPTRVRPWNIDRLLLVWLYRLYPSLLDAIIIVQPETVLRWHRHGFRAYWRWKSRHVGGRPRIDCEMRALIRRMSRENPLWGAPRIHGELLMLGIEVAESTVGRYMVRRRRPPSQGWKTFLRNHAAGIASLDLFVVRTISFKLLYGLVILRHARRRLVTISVTSNPTAEWVSFVAVTQQFNTTTSMGRLTLNVLLSFAQFEREVTGERIRDKIAASKRKGIWMGGLVPLGYEVRDRQLVINEAEAATVRRIFTRYCELGSVRLLKEELDQNGARSKIRASKDGVESGGQAFSRGALYTLLRNPIYVGEIRHKGVCHPGQHAPIVDRAMWDKVAQLLREHGTGCKPRSSSTKSCVLIGKLFDESGEGLTPSHAVKGDRRYRYYVSRSLMKGSAVRMDGGWRLPAAEIERSIAAAAQSILDDQQTVISAVEEAGLDSRRIAPLLKSAPPGSGACASCGRPASHSWVTVRAGTAGGIRHASACRSRYRHRSGVPPGR